MENTLVSLQAQLALSETRRCISILSTPEEIAEYNAWTVYKKYLEALVRDYSEVL